MIVFVRLSIEDYAPIVLGCLRGPFARLRRARTGQDGGDMSDEIPLRSYLTTFDRLIPPSISNIAMYLISPISLRHVCRGESEGGGIVLLDNQE